MRDLLKFTRHKGVKKTKARKRKTMIGDPYAEPPRYIFRRKK